MEVYYTFDDKSVTAQEVFSLLDEMKKSKTDKFSSDNVFHTVLRNIENEKISIENTISVTARDSNNNLIGYLRILTDNVYIFYILDVMVNPNFRNMGIGSNLIEMSVKKCKEEKFIKIFLTSLPGLEEFYKKQGFSEGMSPVLTIRGEDL